MDHDQVDQMIELSRSGELLLADEVNQQHDLGNIGVVFFLLAVEELVRILK